MPNLLIHEQSPYLLQHAHNPVNWHPWGDEPFRLAKAEGKPLIVSIGYAACHWCHVMERESFEDEATAAFMNEHFVCIKVDREEHPDVDQLYMDAVQAISGSGGWPLNVFVTPDRIPFYGGTYFPPAPAYSRPSWMQLMERMSELWTTQRAEVDAQSGQMVQYLRQTAKALSAGKKDIRDEDCTQMAQALLKMADREWGGFGNAPKFPGTMAITFLMEYHFYTGNEEALQQAFLSLDKMIAGGIYDQLGGGFARYSTDREWLAPHFKKMLYDNALLISALCTAYKYSKNPRYRAVALETIAFVNRELRHESGGFYSALDADSEGVEGKFYTWTWEQWLLDSGGGNAFAEACLGIEKQGNWEGTNILHEAAPPEMLAPDFGMDAVEGRNKLDALKKILLSARVKRVRPQLDDKSLLSWNALMNISLVDAATILDDPDCLNESITHMEWMEKSFKNEEGLLLHVWKNGIARIPAKLNDYAYLMLAMIRLGAASGRHEWIVRASALCEDVVRYFGDEAGVFFYYSSTLQTDIPVRKIDVYDGAMPSTNAVMAQVLQLLGMLTERADRTARAEEMLANMTGNASRYTYSFGHWATLQQRTLAVPKTIISTGELSTEHHAILGRKAPPEAIIIHTAIASEILPLTADKKSEEVSLIFVCTGTECYPPVTTPEDALQRR